MNREEEERLAIRISQTLNGLCPSFVRTGRGNCEWHKCDCKANGSSCTCVWHVTDTCVAGKWEKLSFVSKHNDEKVSNQDKELAKATEAANKSNTEEEEEVGIESRSEILDIRDSDI